jgi:hypothetical protein
MKVRTATSLVGVLLVSLFAVAQERTQLPADTVYVSAEGKYEADPDTAQISFNIAVQESTSKAAYERASKSADQVRELLRRNGVDPKVAQVGFFSLQPVYDWRTPKRKLIGYRVSTSVNLKLKDFTKVGPILQGLADLDVTENQSLNYTLDEIDTAKAKAAEDGMRRARGLAEAVAKTGGRTLGTLSSATVDVFEPVIPMMERVQTMRAQTAEGVPAPPPPTAEFTPQKITITAQVKALYRLQ